MNQGNFRSTQISGKREFVYFDLRRNKFAHKKKYLDYKRKPTHLCQNNSIYDDPKTQARWSWTTCTLYESISGFRISATCILRLTIPLFAIDLYCACPSVGPGCTRTGLVHWSCQVSFKGSIPNTKFEEGTDIWTKLPFISGTLLNIQVVNLLKSLYGLI